MEANVKKESLFELGQKGFKINRLVD